jgi:recombination protein RecA
MRIEVRKSVEKIDGEAVANKTKCKVIKNKFASPFGEAEFRIVFGEGIDRTGEILDLAVEHEIVKQGGAWYSYGENKFQGEATVLQLLKDNPELAKEIEDKVLLKIK